MLQQGQVFELASQGAGGESLWAYRYRTAGRDSRRVQAGGFASEQDARDALDRALEILRRRHGNGQSAHARGAGRSVLRAVRRRASDGRETALAARESRRRVRRPPTHRTARRGDRRLADDDPAGYRFEATQALRQVLAKAVVWGMLDVNPAKHGVENPQRRTDRETPVRIMGRTRRRRRAARAPLGPMVIFAAATGMRPGEWVALEHRDIDPDARVAYVRRAFSKGRLKCTKTEASVRAVPLQAIALDALEQLPASTLAAALPGRARRLPRLAQLPHPRLETRASQAGIEPIRRIYDLRHTFATFALRAGISTFDLSRYMGASLTMIDRHYGHLARDGREHAIRLLDALNAPTTVDVRGRSVDVRTPTRRPARTTKTRAEQEISRSPLTDSNR